MEKKDEILLQMDSKKVLVMMRTDVRIKVVHKMENALFPNQCMIFIYSFLHVYPN